MDIKQTNCWYDYNEQCEIYYSMVQSSKVGLSLSYMHVDNAVYILENIF